MKRLLVCGGAAIALLLPLAVRAETLADAVALAYGANPNLQAQRAEARAADEGVVQARAGFGPQLVAGASGGYNAARDPFLGRIDGTSADASLSLSQSLYTSGRLTAGLNASTAAMLASREDLRQVEQQVVAAAISAYVQVRRDKSALEVSRDNLNLLLQQSNDTQARYDSREATGTDRAQAQSRLAAARVDMAQAEGQLADSNTQYLAIVGQNPGELAPMPDIDGIPPSLGEALAVAERRSPSVLGASYRAVGAKAEIAGARSAYGPEVSLSLTGSSGPYSTVGSTRGLQYDSAAARIQVQIPLFASGYNSSRVRQARELNDRAEARTDAASRSAAQDVGRAWSSLESTRRLLVFSEDRVRILQVAYEGAREEQRLGARTTLDVLNQAQELQQAKFQLVQQRATEYIARVQLLQAMGTLELSSLAPQAPIYDSIDHFLSVQNLGGTPAIAIQKRIDRLPARKVVSRIPPDPARGVKPVVPYTLGKAPILRP